MEMEQKIKKKLWKNGNQNWTLNKLNGWKIWHRVEKNEKFGT